jgi:hypothetical protein
VPDRDDVILAEEDVGLAELEVTRDLGQVCRAQHHEHRVLVQLELGSLVCVVGVFDGEIVQPELLLHGAQDVLLRFVQTKPDELVVALESPANLLDADIRNSNATAVGGAIDDRG